MAVEKEYALNVDLIDGQDFTYGYYESEDDALRAGLVIYKAGIIQNGKELHLMNNVRKFTVAKKHKIN